MKIGLIGCGGMGTTHNLSLKALSGKMDVEVTALADCRQEFLERAAKQWPQAKTYVTGRELLENEELDAVHICLPSYLHAEHAVLAMFFAKSRSALRQRRAGGCLRCRRKPVSA